MNIESIAETLLDPARRVNARHSFVYMLFCQDELVYVGFTGSLPERIKAHMTNIGGRIQFDSYSFCGFADYADAVNAERALILKFRPKHNRQIVTTEFVRHKEKEVLREQRRAERAAQRAVVAEMYREKERARLEEMAREFAEHCTYGAGAQKR